MAHNLEIKDGKASCYLYKVGGWHGLGHVSEEALGETEVRKHAGLTYTVEKQELVTAGGLSISDKVATVRTDTKRVLGVVGADYGVVQLDEVFAFIRSLGEFMGNLTYESAFTLGHGEKFAVGIRIEDEMAFGQDKTYPYLYINGSFDGSMRHSVIPTAIREVCQNTMGFAIAAADGNAKFRKHTSGIVQNLNMDKEHFLKTLKAWKEFKAVSKEMIQKKTDESFVDALIVEVFGRVPKEDGKAKTRRINLEDDIYKIYNGDTCKGISGANAFTAFNAVTEYMDHFSIIHENRDGEKMSDEEIAQARFEANVYGRTADKKNALFQFVAGKL